MLKVPSIGALMTTLKVSIRPSDYSGEVTKGSKGEWCCLMGTFPLCVAFILQETPSVQ